MHEICRKNHLARNWQRFSRAFPKWYDFVPKTWILPHDLAEYKLAHSSSRRSSCYIVKPDHGCQGKGILLVKSPKHLEKLQNRKKLEEQMVVQYVFCLNF